jgi:hypothetical protein
VGFSLKKIKGYLRDFIDFYKNTKNILTLYRNMHIKKKSQALKNPLKKPLRGERETFFFIFKKSFLQPFFSLF